MASRRGELPVLVAGTTPLEIVLVSGAPVSPPPVGRSAGPGVPVGIGFAGRRAPAARGAWPTRCHVTASPPITREAEVVTRGDEVVAETEGSQVGNRGDATTGQQRARSAKKRAPTATSGNKAR